MFVYLFVFKNSHENGDSIYEELIQYVLQQSTVRITTSIKALLQKAHFYESLSNLQSISARLDFFIFI